jgi:hypothetical protein
LKQLFSHIFCQNRIATHTDFHLSPTKRTFFQNRFPQFYFSPFFRRPLPGTMGDGQAPSETLASPLLRQPQEVEVCG